MCCRARALALPSHSLPLGGWGRSPTRPTIGPHSHATGAAHAGTVAERAAMPSGGVRREDQVAVQGPGRKPMGSVRMAVHRRRRGGTPPPSPPPPPTKSDHRGENRNLPVGKSGFGSQTPLLRPPCPWRTTPTALATAPEHRARAAHTQPKQHRPAPGPSMQQPNALCGGKTGIKQSRTAPCDVSSVVGLLLGPWTVTVLPRAPQDPDRGSSYAPPPPPQSAPPAPDSFALCLRVGFSPSPSHRRRPTDGHTVTILVRPCPADAGMAHVLRHHPEPLLFITHSAHVHKHRLPGTCPHWPFAATYCCGMRPWCTRCRPRTSFVETCPLLCALCCRDRCHGSQRAKRAAPGRIAGSKLQQPAHCTSPPR